MNQNSLPDLSKSNKATEHSPTIHPSSTLLQRRNAFSNALTATSAINSLDSIPKSPRNKYSPVRRARSTPTKLRGQRSMSSDYFFSPFKDSVDESDEDDDVLQVLLEQIHQKHSPPPPPIRR